MDEHDGEEDSIGPFSVGEGVVDPQQRPVDPIDLPALIGQNSVHRCHAPTSRSISAWIM